jgi:RHS repeat-associated protein
MVVVAVSARRSPAEQGGPQAQRGEPRLGGIGWFGLVGCKFLIDVSHREVYPPFISTCEEDVGVKGLVQASQYGSTNTWGYDPAQQITSTTNPSSSFGFDTVGNPTGINGTSQAFKPGGEICWSGTGTGACGTPPAGVTGYLFNQNGERTSTGGDTFGYDANGQMTTAATTAGASSYSYATGGLRTSKVVAGATTTFAWDDTTPTPQLIQDGAQYYVYGPDGLPVERIGTNPTRWLYIDATGSIIASTDWTGTIVANRTYDPWGNTTAHTGTPVSLGWQHQYQDPETGLYDLWHRYYDPATAQFTTPDPLYPLTRSRYGYAGNDQVNGSDPTGLSWYNPCIGHTCASDVASGAVNATVTATSVGMANCVRYVTWSSSTASIADTHPVLRDTLYVTAGAAATVASGGLLLEAGAAYAAGAGIGAAGYAEGLAAVGAGGFVAAGDYGRCAHGGDRLACIGFASGLAGAGLGLGALLPGAAGLLFGGIGLAPAGAGLIADLLGLGEEAYERLFGCD